MNGLISKLGKKLINLHDFSISLKTNPFLLLLTVYYNKTFQMLAMINNPITWLG